MIWRGYRYFLIILSVPLILRRLFEGNRERATPASARDLAALAVRSIRNTMRIETASGFLEHLLIADSVLRAADLTSGVVVECGAYKGGSTANLSLACDLAGRELHVFDSFEGLPDPAGADRAHVLQSRGLVHTYEARMYAGTLEEVKRNVSRFGAIHRCHFHPGFFEDTLRDTPLPPIVVAFIDVDLVQSLMTCLRAVWPALVVGGVLYVHEAEHREIARLFFDVSWWGSEFGHEPPGLIGAGSGLGLDPSNGYWRSSLAFTVKAIDWTSLPEMRG